MKFTPHTEKDRKEMLEAIGVNNIEELFSDIPDEVQRKASCDVSGGLSEYELRKAIKALASKNKTNDEFISFLGAGAYDHHIPAFIDQLLLRSEFYTAYTPYQPEISQGTLQAIFEYQTLICELTGMEAANASMYDGASAVAEAALMAASATRRKKILVSEAIHPEYMEVINAYISGHEIEVEKIEAVQGISDYKKASESIDKTVAAVIIQYPNFYGNIEDLKKFAELAHRHKALLIAAVADPVSLGILKSPGELGADIVVGEGQSFGNNLYFGGPYLGFLATKEKYIRRMPGRIVGKTKDVDGKTGYVLTLQAREQHIRREKATSNICSNEALCALAATMSLCAFGKQGIKELAYKSTQKAHYALEKLVELPGVEAAYDQPFFKEFVIKLPEDAGEIVEKLKDEGILAGVPLGRFDSAMNDKLLVCVTELRAKEEIDLLVEKLGGILA